MKRKDPFWGSRRAGVQVNIRLTQEEADRLRQEAKRWGTTVSGLIRAAAMKEARRRNHPSVSKKR